MGRNKAIWHWFVASSFWVTGRGHIKFSELEFHKNSVGLNKMKIFIYRTLYSIGIVIQICALYISLTHSHEYMQMFYNSTLGGDIGFLIGMWYIYYFFCLIYSLLRIFSRRQKNKLKWLLIVLLIPIIGVFIYYERNIFNVPKLKETLNNEILEMFISQSVKKDNYQIQLMRRRSLAFLIDYGLYALLCGIYIYKIGENTLSGIHIDGGWHSLAFPLLWLIWFPLSETLFGQTLGKRLMKIMVVNRHCERPDILESIKRHILDPIDISYFSYIPIFFKKKNIIPRRLGDYFAKTWVLMKLN